MRQPALEAAKADATVTVNGYSGVYDAAAHGASGTVVGVALAAFDDRNAFRPTEHIWLSEKMDWVRVDDGLKQYQETVPQ